MHKGSGTRDTTNNLQNAPGRSATARADHINDRIRAELSAVCKDRGISYTDLAKMCGLSIAVVSRILAQGRVAATNSPKFAHVILIYEALGLQLPFGPQEIPKYSHDELTAILARVISAPSFIPSNSDLATAERQAITLIATGSVQAR